MTAGATCPPDRIEEIAASDRRSNQEDVSQAEARQQEWLKQNAVAFAAQAAWHERNGHPLEDILSTPSQLGIQVIDLTEDEVMRDLDTLAE